MHDLIRPVDFSRAILANGAVDWDKLTVSETVKHSGPRLALVGVPLLLEGGAIFDQIEAAGGQVVLDATETGELGLVAPFDPARLQADPLEELARLYFNIPHVFRRPNNSYYAWLEQMLVARQVTGIVLIRHPWCDIWHAELPQLQAHSGLPVLDLDLGSEPGAEARNETRLQAFLEMLA